MNKVILSGRLTKDIVLKVMQNGKSFVNFTLAVTKQYKKGEAVFINCQAWGKTAEFLANHMSKGCMIAVEGRIQTRNYEGNDGKKVYVIEVVVDNVEPITWPKKEEELEGFAELDDDEELPF